jgi:hypothetical protein
MLPKPWQNLPLVSLLEPGIPDWRLPCVFSERKLSLMHTGQHEGRPDSSDHITRAFPVVWCPGFMAVTPSFTHLSIKFSNQRFSNYNPTVDIGFVKLMSDRFCGIFSFSVIRAAVVLRFFETILLNLQRSLSVSVDFSLLFFFADNCHLTQSLTHLHELLQSVNKRRNIQCCQLKLFQCS